MALQLMKLLVTATTATNVVPASAKFFNVTAADTAAGATLTIGAADFFTDTGAAATELPTIDTNSFFVVYVNGLLQMNSLVTYTAGAAGTGQIAIQVPAGGEPIPTGTPIVLSIETFAPTSTTTVTT